MRAERPFRMKLETCDRQGFVLQRLYDSVVGARRNLQPFAEFGDMVLVGGVYGDALGFHDARKARTRNDLHFVESVLYVRRDLPLVDDFGLEASRDPLDLAAGSCTIK